LLPDPVDLLLKGKLINTGQKGEIGASEHLSVSLNFSKISRPFSGYRGYWPMRAKCNDLREISKWMGRNTLKSRGTGAESLEIKMVAGKFPTSVARQVFHKLFRPSGRFEIDTSEQLSVPDFRFSPTGCTPLEIAHWDLFPWGASLNLGITGRGQSI
jgi:hypothetical protein